MCQLRLLAVESLAGLLLNDTLQLGPNLGVEKSRDRDFLKNLKLTDPLAMEVLIWPYSRLLIRIGWLLSNIAETTLHLRVLKFRANSPTLISSSHLFTGLL